MLCAQIAWSLKSKTSICDASLPLCQIEIGQFAVAVAGCAWLQYMMPIVCHFSMRKPKSCFTTSHVHLCANQCHHDGWTCAVAWPPLMNLQTIALCCVHILVVGNADEGLFLHCCLLMTSYQKQSLSQSVTSIHVANVVIIIHWMLQYDSHLQFIMWRWPLRDCNYADACSGRNAFFDAVRQRQRQWIPFFCFSFSFLRSVSGGNIFLLFFSHKPILKILWLIFFVNFIFYLYVCKKKLNSFKLIN